MRGPGHVYSATNPSHHHVDRKGEVSPIYLSRKRLLKKMYHHDSAVAGRFVCGEGSRPYAKHGLDNGHVYCGMNDVRVHAVNDGRIPHYTERARECLAPSQSGLARHPDRIDDAGAALQCCIVQVPMTDGREGKISTEFIRANMYSRKRGT